MNLCVSVRVGEYFVEKKRPRQIRRQRQMRLNGGECFCLHLEMVSFDSAAPHRSFPPEPVLCQGEEQKGGKQAEKCLNTFSQGLCFYLDDSRSAAFILCVFSSRRALKH